MRILQLSTFDIRFGAAIAARRLHEALLSNGQECDMLVADARSGAPRTHSAFTGFSRFKARVRHTIDKWPLSFYPNRTAGQFSTNWVPSHVYRNVDRLRPDVVHMHWFQSNFVATPTLLRLKRPLVWTFHDMWAFTGGCHYTAGCNHYLGECGECPILNSSKKGDLSHWLWKQKRSVYRQLRKSLQIVCPSNWMADLARRAPLLEGIPVHAVPNPINTQVFRPIEKKAARRLLGLPEEGHLMLMGAAFTADRRKGFDLLDTALRHYAEQPGTQPLGLVTLDAKKVELSSKPEKLRLHNLGFLQDEISLSALYNAVDIMALPSREENLSNALAESLCCGTPCLAFRIGGNADLVTHQINGYLAEPGDTTGMAEGLAWILNHLGESARNGIAESAHGKVSYESLVPVFLRIYESGFKQVS